jgi:glucan phosphoethanolaminetransferase (alkaline phosphatase superfamily)
MRALLHPRSLIILASYLLLTLVPFVSLLFGKPVSDGLHLLAIEALLWLVVWSIFKRPAWFHWLLLPAFFSLPIELYLRTYYGQGLSTHHLGILAETSPKETAEFLGSKIWVLAAILMLIAAWWWIVLKAAIASKELDWHGKTRYVMLVLLCVAIGISLYGYAFGIAPAGGSPTQSSAATSASTTANHIEVATVTDANPSGQFWSPPPQLPDWASIPLETSTLSRTWPFGIVLHGHDFWTERTYLADLKGKSSNFTFGAQQLDADDTPQIAVMVIGESSRYDRWSINGYVRETNPLLKGEANLVSLSNVISGVSATRLSVPVLVSRKPAMQSLKAGFTERSLLSAFREAGFKTYWLSNQMSFGQFDTPVSVFANEADVTQFMNLGGFTNNSSLDEVLLAPLKSALTDGAKKKLIVLHTLGNHWNYSHRYPKEYDRWKPSLFGVENPAYTDLAIKADINNSYDNSILYTDWFLSEVIATLKSSGQVSTMMYVSDHGQTLYDGACNLAFHGHNTQYEFHVPALVWYSNAYQAKFPGKVQQLKLHHDARLSTENMFHSLLDLSSIRYASEQLQWSFLSKDLKRHKRYVDSYGWSDYDNSTFKGDCREVIDNGKPLPQER